MRVLLGAFGAFGWFAPLDGTDPTRMAWEQQLPHDIFFPPLGYFCFRIL